VCVSQFVRSLVPNHGCSRFQQANKISSGKIIFVQFFLMLLLVICGILLLFRSAFSQSFTTYQVRIMLQ
jgi:cytochrome b subunit of formate dehydrogenase